jgi:uncharacterized Fe-S center protein
MSDILFYPTDGSQEGSLASLKTLLAHLKHPFHSKDSVGIKLHWGERDNHSYLPPVYAREIVHWLQNHGAKPFIFDTTVLYSGGRRTGKDSIETAASHGYTEEYLGCPIVIADGMDGRDVIDIPAELNHFETVQVASIIEKTNGFVIFSHFKAHLASGFGGAIKNMAMGFASRAQKQRMHADVRPSLNKNKCTKCGLCIEVCPTGAAQVGDDEYPIYNLDECIGCAQCIGLCPEMALKITWGTNKEPFQEKLIETASAIWQYLKDKTVLVNALLNITSECDCLPGKPEFIAKDMGFVGGYHPVVLDDESLEIIGKEPFIKAHPKIPWQRQFDYAREIGFFADE